MIKFAEPTVEDLTDALADAIPLARKAVPSEFHAKVHDFHPAASRRARIWFVLYEVYTLRTACFSVLEETHKKKLKRQLRAFRPSVRPSFLPAFGVCFFKIGY